MRDELHSRVVGGAKLVLPLLALALLSTMFLLARTVDPDAALPVAEFDLSERARDAQLTTPRVSGLTSGGTPFLLSADAARPDPDDPRRMGIDRLTMVLDGGAAAGARVAAARGEVDTAGRTVVLEGEVAVDAAGGWRLRTQRLEGSFAALRIVAPGPIAGEGPLGRVSAGGMVLEERDGARRLVFTGGVDLLYRPPAP